MSKHLKHAVACALIGFVLLGCSRRPPALNPVSGTASVNGMPAGKLLLVFYRVDDPAPYPTPSTALTDDAGAFSLTTAVAGDGIADGQYAVVCHWYESCEVKDGENIFGGEDRLGDKYGDNKRTPLRVTIQKNQKDPLRIELTVP